MKLLVGDGIFDANFGDLIKEITITSDNGLIFKSTSTLKSNAQITEVSIDKCEI